MCLYPRLIDNRKYKANKKNGGVIPPKKDPRVSYVPIGCGKCIDCRKQKTREWMARLLEDIKVHKNGKFVAFTFSTESLRKIIEEDEESYQKSKSAEKLKWNRLSKLHGYELDNAIATKAMRLFLERWRKKYKKSLRHWAITELGHGRTEHLHIHAIVWTDKPEELEPIWKYGTVWRGKPIQKEGGRIEYENYVNDASVGYITKYVTKVDEQHPNYTPKILCSPGIGDNYTKTYNGIKNRYNEKDTNEAYRTTKGYKIGLPIYWRNKIYTEEQREELWIQKLDKGIRNVCGEKVHESDTEAYNNLLEYHRERTRKLGYSDPDFLWSKKAYEEQRRKMIQEKRIWNRGQ